MVINICSLFYKLFLVYEDETNEFYFEDKILKKYKTKFYKFLKHSDKVLKTFEDRKRKLETEISLIPDEKIYRNFKEAKIKILKELEVAEEIKITKLVENFKKELPVIFVLSEENNDAIRKNKELLELYKSYFISKYGKDYITFNLTQFSDLLGKFAYELTFGYKRNIMLERFKKIVNVEFENEDISKSVIPRDLNYFYKSKILHKNKKDKK